ncbi:hypothetical protein L2E82_33325 [Cichorium intybus]|uniref:Uncharacterized protein n=1 Tax=Cichorium intybus TaxID=13427 RepID=A0ACB9BJV1_CICIN|nr:hypothetical protein L2E82_33325 [Cichorium intybus]
MKEREMEGTKTVVYSLLLQVRPNSNQKEQDHQLTPRRFLQLVAAMDFASNPSFPVRYKKFSIDIKESKIDIVICSHDDQFLVIATQIGTMGTILHARKEEGMLNNPTFNVSVIFGKRDEPMLVACARQLIEHISNSGSSKPLTLSLGLKDHSMETLKGIVSAVIENKMW